LKSAIDAFALQRILASPGAAAILLAIALLIAATFGGRNYPRLPSGVLAAGNAGPASDAAIAGLYDDDCPKDDHDSYYGDYDYYGDDDGKDDGDKCPPPKPTKPPHTATTAPSPTKAPHTATTAPSPTKPPHTATTAPSPTKPPHTATTAPSPTSPPATATSVPSPTRTPVTPLATSTAPAVVIASPTVSPTIQVAGVVATPTPPPPQMPGVTGLPRAGDGGVLAQHRTSLTVLGVALMVLGVGLVAGRGLADSRRDRA
jgi:hypothetical protein